VRPGRPATVRFYLDEDVLGLAKVVASLRDDVTYPGDLGATIRRRSRPACPISRGEKDPEWIPKVSGFGWLSITRDSDIQRHPSHMAAVRAHNARMVALSGAQAIGTWAQLEILLSNWRRIEDLLAEPGPFIYTATRSGIRRQPLQ